MTIALGDRELIHTIWVAEIEPEGILGLDFLRQYEKMVVMSYSLAISVKVQLYPWSTCHSQLLLSFR